MICMETHSQKIAVIGGGPAGMLACLLLADAGCKNILLLERNDRLGRKLSATGNGQGNITNEDMGAHRYFSSDREKAGRILAAFGKWELIEYLVSLGGLFVADGEGRVYPASRQAASVTDIMRFALASRGVCVHTGEFVRGAQKREGKFRVFTDKAEYCADYLIVAAGGKASPHFGSDGNGYALARSFGHTVTALSPALVQLRTDRENIKGLKGIRAECALRLLRGEEIFACRGDVIFTDYGVSGNAVFRASSFARENDVLSLDFLPDCEEDKLVCVLKDKAENCGALLSENLLRCIVHSAVAGCVLRSLGVSPSATCASLRGRANSIARRVKDFRLHITGSMGFENAQITKGGVPLGEVDEYLMSVKVPGLFFAGEVLDVDGECGGYNLQWAFSSGARCAKRIASL